MLQQQAMMVSFLSVAVEIPLTMGPFFKPWAYVQATKGLSCS